MTLSTPRRPIMRLLDLLGQRWALRILWELRDGPLRSRALRQACDEISPTVLQKRVDELAAAGLIALNAKAGYELTSLGREFYAAFTPLYRFADVWAAAQEEQGGEGRSSNPTDDAP